MRGETLVSLVPSDVISWVLFVMPDDVISWVFFVFIVLSFACFVRAVLNQKCTLTKHLNSITKGVTRADEAQGIGREERNYVYYTDRCFKKLTENPNVDPNIANVLAAFKNGLLSFRIIDEDNERYCNSASAQDTISLHSLAPFFSDIKHATPSLLTGLGVLGTFVGLLFALQGVDLASISDINQTSVQLTTILNGAKTAFVTSVWGVTFSFLSTVFYNWALKGAIKDLRKLQDELDDIYKPNVTSDVQFRALGAKTDSVQDCIIDLKNSIVEALEHNASKSAEIITNTIKDYMRELDDRNSHAIDQAVEKFSNALTSQINNYRQVIENAGSIFSEKVRDSANLVESKFNDWGDKFAGISETIGNSLQSIKDDMQNWARVSKSLSVSIAKISDFGEQSAESVNKLCELKKDLDEKFKSLAEVQINVTEQTSSFVKNMDKLMQGLKEVHGYSQGLENSLKELAQIKELVNASLSTNMKLYTEQVAKVTGELNGKWKQAYEERLKFYENAITTSMNQIVNATNAVNNMANKMR